MFKCVAYVRDSCDLCRASTLVLKCFVVCLLNFKELFCFSSKVLFHNVQELLRQREQLERTEKRLDDINNTLRFSQKHIQGIKVKIRVFLLTSNLALSIVDSMNALKIFYPCKVGIV